MGFSFSPTDVRDAFAWKRAHVGIGWTLAMLELVAFAAFFGWFYFWKYRPLKKARKHRGPVLRGQILAGQGIGRDDLEFVIRGESLWDFRDQYRVAMVVGMNDPSMDKYEDTRISIGTPFTITKQNITMRVPYPNVLIEARDRAIAEAKRRVKERNPDTPPGTPIFVEHELSAWHEPILIPVDLDSSNIRRLSDVPRYNGKLIGREHEEGRLPVAAG